MDRTEKILKVAMITSWSVVAIGAVTTCGLLIYNLCKPNPKEPEKEPEQQEEVLQESAFENSQSYGEYKFECDIERTL